MKKYLTLLLLVLLMGCTPAKTIHNFKVNCLRINVFDFHVNHTFLRFKITGFLEQDAEIYIDTFDKQGEGYVGGAENFVIPLKKGEVNINRSIECYYAQGRVIYIPTSLFPFRDDKVENSKKDSLLVQVQMGYDKTE